ncbi:MAG: helix-turn-helix domain-containing protein [Aeromonadaceae bacterium]
MKVTNSTQLSAYLKDIRQTRKLSQEKVACKVGIRQDTVSSFERNADATKLETLFKILSALELELVIQPRNSPPGVAEENGGGWKEEW